MAITASFISPQVRLSRVIVDADLDMENDYTSGTQQKIVVDVIDAHEV